MRFGGDVTCTRVSQALLMPSARCMSNRHMTGVPKDSADLPASAARVFVCFLVSCLFSLFCLSLFVVCVFVERKLIDQVDVIPHIAFVKGRLTRCVITVGHQSRNHIG